MTKTISEKKQPIETYAGMDGELDQAEDALRAGLAKTGIRA